MISKKSFRTFTTCMYAQILASAFVSQMTVQHMLEIDTHALLQANDETHHKYELSPKKVCPIIAKSQCFLNLLTLYIKLLIIKWILEISWQLP